MPTSDSDRPRIVVGVDGSDHSRRALRWAARIARAEGAEIDAVAVWEYPTYTGFGNFPEDYFPQNDMEQALAEAVDEVLGADRPDGLRLMTARGRAASVLIEASKDALMVVVGSRGHGGFAGLLLGSVSTKVAEHASCPVLVVHERSQEQ